MLSRIEELSLIARCIATDNRDAFGRLVTEYEHSLRRFLLNLTNDPELTSDIAQETFLKAYLSIKSFRGISRFKTWLYRIAYNEYISYRRKYGITVEIPDNIIETADESDSTSSISIDLDHYLSALNDTERTIVLLFYLEDQPIKKISEITGITSGTIKCYLNRARKKMQTITNS